MQEVYDYLKNAGVYYLATVEGDHPRVRPFGTYLITNGRLYIQTGKSKPCSKQMGTNPKIEIAAMGKGDLEGTWIRIAATAVNDDSIEVKQAMLDAYPQLKGLYDAADDNTQVLYLKDATATIAAHGSEPKVIKF